MLTILTIVVVLGGIVLYLESVPVQATIEGGENGWGTEYIMPLPETNFQAIGNWEISPVGSASISGPGQGYIDGEGNEACLIAESSASYVDIWRYIEWEGRLAYADGTKLTLSVFAALYDSTYQGQIQLGVVWIYHSGPDTLVEYDFSERVDLSTEWSRIPLIADFSEASESSLYKVKLIIRLHPDGLTKAKIDRFRLCVTEGQCALLSHERRFQSNLILESITQDMQEVNTAKLSLSCGIDTGDDWYYGWVIYKRHIIDYINFTVRTPYEGTKNTDSLDINSPSMFSADGSFDDFAALWETVVAINEEWEFNRNILETTATYAMGFFPFGGHISAALSYARAGEYLRTLGEGGIVYPHGTGSGGGRELTCWQEVNALDEMGVQGSLYLRDIIASVPIVYQWKGDPNIDILLEIEVTIGWEEAFYSSEIGENTLFLISNPTETTHTYTVNLKKGDPWQEWDTDGDGLSDANEKDDDVYNCTTDHTNPDSDYDGLSDKEEILYELTEPNDPDTDDDGFTDGYEVNTLGTSPLSDDTDEDGLSDYYEVYTSLTDPTNPDTDGDGLNDGVDPYPLNGQTQLSWITPSSEGASVTGIVTIEVDVSDSEGLDSVQYKIDNGDYTGMDTNTGLNYQADWDSTPFSEGEHTITIRTTDGEGFQTYFTRNVIVYSTFDAIITFISPTPSANSVVSGTITIRVEASDEDGLLDVECQVDSDSYNSMTNYSSYYEIDIDTTNYQDGTVWVTVRTTDISGDQTAIQREFRFYNYPDPATVTFINPTEGATVSGIITIQVEALDLDGLELVEYNIDGDPYQEMQEGGSGAGGDSDAFQVTWVTANTEANQGQHTIYIRTTDALGDQDIFTCTVTVDNRAQLSWSNPSAGEAVHHTITIRVHVSDPNGISSVRFKINSGSYYSMSHVGSGYYEASWDTTSYSDGSHTITIKVTDSTGAQRWFSRAVDVVNSARVGSVTILSPSSGSTVGVVVSITASASDPDGISSIQWRVAGVTSWTSMTYSSGTWHGTWYQSVSPGWYSLQVRMIDNWGDIVTTSISIRVIGGPM